MRFVLASFVCLSAFAASPARLLDPVPIRFERGSGPVRWGAHGFGYALSFTDQSTIFRLDDRAIQLSFPGSNASARFEATGRASAATNYFIGNRSLSVPGYRRLRHVGVYPGIDVVYYGNGRQMEYDFGSMPGEDRL